MNLDAYFLFEDSKFNIEDNEILSEINVDGVAYCLLNDDWIPSLLTFLVDNQCFGKGAAVNNRKYNEMISRGYKCVIAKSEESVVGMGWFCVLPKEKWPDFAKFPDISDHAALLLTDFVSPQYRGKGIHKRLTYIRKIFASKYKRDRVVSFVGVKNVESARNYINNSTRYRLIYNVILEISRVGKVSFFVNKKRENWNEL